MMMANLLHNDILDRIYLFLVGVAVCYLSYDLNSWSIKLLAVLFALEAITGVFLPSLTLALRNKINSENSLQLPENSKVARVWRAIISLASMLTVSFASREIEVYSGIVIGIALIGASLSGTYPFSSKFKQVNA